MKTYTVFGPPGTGKTTEMLRRVKGMVDSGVPESGINFMSFTKAAAQEALSRVGASRSDNFSTIHSLCYRLTKVNHNAVVDYKKLGELSKITNVVITCRGIDEDDLGDGDLYLQIIGKASNLRVSNEEAYETSERPGSYGGFMMFAKAYNEWKKAYGYVDYNDMLERVLGKNIKFGGTHLVIDEAQDLSPLQWMVINRLIELASPQEVHVCGDDDQALYRWAGADPHGMDKFELQYGSSRHVLAQSWRVPNSVHRVADNVLGRISRRVEKEYKPRNEEGIVERSFDFDMLKFPAGEDTMILGRTHSILKDVEETLRNNKVLFSKNGGRQSLYNNIYANSIRGIAKVRDDKALSDVEYKSLLRTIRNPVIKGEVEAGDYSSLKKYWWVGILDIPYHLSEYYNNVDVTKTPTVTISTIHGAKGREADRVVLLTRLTPRIQESLSDGAISADDEHRVFYVGVTRAKNKLSIIQDYEGYDL